MVAWGSGLDPGRRAPAIPRPLRDLAAPGLGAALNTHFHFHVVVLDGVLSQADNAEARFREVARLTPEHWHELQHVVQRRVLRYFHRRGLLDEADANGMLSWQPTNLPSSPRTRPAPRRRSGSDSGLRSHRGRARTRLRLRPVAARRVRRLRVRSSHSATAISLTRPPLAPWPMPLYDLPRFPRR